MKKGALIGVATTVHPRTGPGPRSAAHFFRMAERARSTGARLVLFDPREGPFSRGELKGYTLADLPGGGIGWRKEIVRWPDAIYENVFVHLAVQGAAASMRRYASAQGTPVFNPVVPGKATLAAWVNRHPECGAKVPVTVRVKGAQTVREMVERFGAAYVKPVGGYGGRGVLRVRKAHGNYRVDCDRCRGGRPFRLVLTESGFSHFIHRATSERPHIAQQPVPLLRVENGQIDFRVVVQRDRRGEWQLVGIVPKIAARDGVVTNLVAGGRRTRLEEIARLVPNRAFRDAAHRLEETAKRISRLVAARYPTFGIAGYDLGLDADGLPWFIELNPKPARRLLYPEMGRRAGDLAVDFARYLAEK